MLPLFAMTYRLRYVEHDEDRVLESEPTVASLLFSMHRSMKSRSYASLSARLAESVPSQ